MIFFNAIFFLVLLPSVALGNIKRIETASNGIAQIVDFCTEKFSTRFTLVIAGEHPDLMRISSYIIERTSTQNERNHKLLSGYEAQIFLTYGNIDEPRVFIAST